MTVYIRVYVSMEFIVYSRHNNIPDMCKYTLSLDKYTQPTKKYDIVLPEGCYTKTIKTTES